MIKQFISDFSTFQSTMCIFRFLIFFQVKCYIIFLKMLFMLCPCQSHHTSATSYSECCAVLHQHQAVAQTAEQLMRSRYSAFVLQKIDYIIETTVPAQQSQLNHAELLEWSETTNWKGLEVIQHTPYIDKIHSLVEFKAYFQHDDEIKTHHELSAFVQIDQQWYFIDPTLAPVLTMKQECWCNSGKKFKHCCAKFL